ncbi:MAG: BCCT family transporter, partial [Saprospiraceae bacterium]|nr:BCCT family transporter [Saprospiraceae bacterium]
MNLLLIQKARQNYLLYASLLFSVLFLVCGVLFPDALVSGLNKTNAQLLAVFSNYYLWVGLLVVLTALVVLFLPISKKRLGTAEPEYSWFSWIALLYSTGMGSGLLLRAVQEPVYYLHNPPVNGMDAKQMALQYTFFHWGVTPWAMYSVFGLIVAYNLYLRKAPNFLQAIVVDDKAKFVQKTVPFFIVIITIAGVIASLGLGTGQFIGGLNQYFSLDLGNSFLLLTVFGIGLTGTLSALTGINKVIKYLADFDMTVSIMLMIFIALFLNFSNFFSNT